MEEILDIKETIELFVNTTVGQLIREQETPRVNFVFQESAYETFYEVMKNPYKKPGYWSPDIKLEDISQLRNMYDIKYPTIYVKDHHAFFCCLTDIANLQIKQYNKYGEQKISRQLLIQLMRRIWLRMNSYDFYDVESFLARQKSFTENELLDDFIFGVNLAKFHGHEVLAENKSSRTWDEAPNCMTFKIIYENTYHSLPHIFYGIIDNTCYIYAIQNDKVRKRNSEIEKIVYKEYRGKGQPSMVYTMKLFMDILKDKGITTIKVPKLQVLSYRYHQLLSQKAKYDFETKWTKEKVEALDSLTGWKLEMARREYEFEKAWYDNVVDKEDLISTNKTTNFINLMERIVKEDESLSFIDENKNQDELTIRVNQKVKKLTSTL